MKFPKHTNDEVCLGCEARLKGGHPLIVEFFRFVKQKFKDAHCSWVHRGEESQNEAFDQGLSKLRFPNSKHNLLPAEAIDIFQIIDGSAVFDPVFCAGVNKLSKLNGFNLRWGGDFRTLGDSGHWETDKKQGG